MAYDHRKTVPHTELAKKKAKVIEFPRNPKAGQTPAYCSNCKERFPNNFNYCPDCGRALMLRQQ